MKKYLLMVLAVTSLVISWACHPTLPVTPTPPVPTVTPTMGATPVCGFTSVTLPTPVTAPSAPGTFFFVIRTLADWQNYYGSTSAPVPPANLANQMILINLQSVPVSQYILPYLPYSGTCSGNHYVYESDLNYPTPSPLYNYTVSVQNVCSTPGNITVSYDQYTSQCNCPPLTIIPLTPGPNFTPIPVLTPVPTATPSPGDNCNPGVGDTIYLYDAVGVVVPASPASIIWDQSGTLQTPGLICPCPV